MGAAMGLGFGFGARDSLGGRVGRVVVELWRRESGEGGEGGLGIGGKKRGDRWNILGKGVLG